MKSLWDRLSRRKSERNSNKDVDGGKTKDTTGSPSSLSKANTTFSLALLRKLNEYKTANIFFSPFSISSALVMAMLGARGNTATQISECLGIQDCQDDVHAVFGEMLREMNKPGSPFVLSVANRLYGEKSYGFLQEFLTQTKTHYDSELEAVNFRTSSEEARVKINNWVEEKTQGKIKDMVPVGGVDRMTRMVLVNALYFIGSWNETFDRSSTYEAQFRLNKNTTKPVQLMNQENYFPITVIREVDCQILEMPYRGKELSMLIILPKDIEDDTTGLEKLEKCLTYEKFTKWTHPNKMKRRKIEVKLPRFKLEETYDLNEVLGSMGMVDAFDQTKCDFSGMSGNKALYLSNVSHKAFVDVNEEGTEAGAVTDTKSCSLFDSPPNFIADHPFLFFIRHNRTLSVLFAGRFCCPE